MSIQHAVILLDGFYDARFPEFFEESCERDGVFVVCADGALNVCDFLLWGFAPNLVVGDMDSLIDIDRDEWEAEGTRFDDTWAGRTAKNHTDGQLALYAALDAGARDIDIHGGLPREDVYDHEHFMGNLSLLFEAHERLVDAPDAAVRFLDPFQTIHLCRHSLTVTRANPGLNRVSLVPFGVSARVARSEGVRWDLAGLEVRAAPANALRNEFDCDADAVTIELADGSAPVYVFHNWYGEDVEA